MIIDLGQIFSHIADHFPVFLMIIALFFILLGFAIIETKPFKMHLVDKMNQVRTLSLTVGIIIFVIGLIVYLVPFFPRTSSQSTATVTVKASTPTATVRVVSTPTATVNVVSTPTNDFTSSFIPGGQAPVINDPLKDDSQGYAWDDVSEASGSCHFMQGQYLLASPAGNSDGIGCTPENGKGVFSNFVYQIEMTTLTGLDGGGAGPTFRVDTAGNGQQYQVQFDVSGNWQVETDAKPLTSISTPCGNPCPFFHSGLNKSNVITIFASGQTIRIQINGHPLGSYIDSTYASGYIGVQLTAGAHSTSVAFSNVRVWRL